MSGFAHARAYYSRKRWRGRRRPNPNEITAPDLVALLNSNTPSRRKPILRVPSRTRFVRYLTPRARTKTREPLVVPARKFYALNVSGARSKEVKSCFFFIFLLNSCFDRIRVVNKLTDPRCKHRTKVQTYKIKNLFLLNIKFYEF